MVSKGRSMVGQRATDGRSAVMNGRARGLKIYADAQKATVGGSDCAGVEDAKSLSTAKGINREFSSDLKVKVENSDNWKGKRVSNGNTKERKALADISNARSNLSRGRANGESKLVLSTAINKGKNIYMPRDSVGRTKIDANAPSRKSVTASVVASEKCKSKQVRSVNVNVGRKVSIDVSNVNAYLPKTRNSHGAKLVYEETEKSGPVLGTINRGKNLPRPRISVGLTTASSKLSSRKPVLGSLNSSGRHSGNSVKFKIRRKVAPDLSNARGSSQKNRSSDSFISLKQKTERCSSINGIPMHPNLQVAGNVNAQSRRSLQSIGKNALAVFNGQMKSKSKLISALKMSTSAAATSLKKKNNIQTNVIPKNVAFLVSNECNLEKTPSDERSNSSIGTTADATLRTKRVRRRSFTSSFMARLEEKLPNIDDDRNPLEVSAYIDDIYQYYWVMEAQHPSMANYMETQQDITPDMRGVLINWLIEVHLKYKLMAETLFLMVALFDRFLSVVKIGKSEIQLVGLTALLLASKYEDFWHPRVGELISFSAGSYTSAHMLEMEKRILEKLMFRLNIPTPYVFMLRFLKAAQSDRKLENLSFYLIELCLVKYEALNFKASLLAASAIYVARCTLRITPAWTPLLCKHAHYEESQLRDCASMILNFQKVASAGPLMVTYEKYTHPKRSRVAEITPIDKLPQ